MWVLVWFICVFMYTDIEYFEDSHLAILINQIQCLLFSQAVSAKQVFLLNS